MQFCCFHSTKKYVSASWCSSWWSECSKEHETLKETKTNSKVSLVKSVLCILLHWRQMCSTLQPHNLRGETNYHLQAASYSLVSPMKSRVDSLFPSVIILSADPPSSPSLRILPSLYVIHFSSAVSPSFNTCHYWQDASSQNINPSFDAVLKDYTDTWVCPGIKIALAWSLWAIKHFHGWLPIKAKTLHLLYIVWRSYHERLINKLHSLL